ncbi:hypothetical protein FRC10_006416 [Ceratobasidium sp. 414]|nr:hypothetical protein FRC10_006416 [Ceratobasidium sp. 414]
MTSHNRYGPPTPSPQDIELLGETLTFSFSKRVSKSRFFKSATTERMFSWDQKDLSKRGAPLDRITRLYETWGQGGYGLILTGNVSVHPEQLESPGNAVVHELIETPERLELFQKMATAGKANGSLVVMQLSHAGATAPSYINANPVSAGDVRSEDCISHGQPVPLTKEQIEQVESEFVYAAWSAHRAGFDGIQLHAAFGFLLAQFLSTKTNNRADEYGGCLSNRSRIICEIIQKIRSKVTDPGFIIGVKISLGEFQGKINEAVELCQKLESLSVDFVDLSGGKYGSPEGQESGPSPLEEVWVCFCGLEARVEISVPQFAQQASSSLTKTLVFIAGELRSSEAMAAAVRSGHCAGVGLGYPSASDPYLPVQILSGQLGGATKPDADNLDSSLLSMAAGTQMEAIARGDVVFDLSNPRHLHEFNNRARVFLDQREEMLKNGIVEAGYMVWSPTTGD